MGKHTEPTTGDMFRAVVKVMEKDQGPEAVDAFLATLVDDEETLQWAIDALNGKE